MPPPTARAEPLDSEHPLFILYTSGSTGKPKGILHTTAGYLLGTSLTHKWVFDLKDDDIYWCTADIGWVTGHSYIVYGPLANGATVVMYEGAPNHPREDRFWEIIEKYRVTIFYTAPTAIRAFIKWGDHMAERPRPVEPAPAGQRRRADQSRSLDVVSRDDRRRTLPDRRYLVADRDRRDHDRARCPAPRRPSPAVGTLPLPGVVAEMVDEHGQAGAGRAAAAGWSSRKPWPGMLRTICGDDERYKPAILEHRCRTATSPPTTPAAMRTATIWIMGRIDDVLNVSRPSPEHDGSRERPGAPRRRWPRPPWSAGRTISRAKGIACFVTLKAGFAASEALKRSWATRRKEIGALAGPDDIRFTVAAEDARARSCGAAATWWPQNDYQYRHPGGPELLLGETARR